MVKAVGISTVHFGIIITVNLAIGLFHPPIRDQHIRGAVGAWHQTGNNLPRHHPFVVIYLIALAVITYIPAISLLGVQNAYGCGVRLGLICSNVQGWEVEP